MTDAAAFKACYADWKLIKTRSTVQIVLEVPVERAGLAYEVLGGMPQPGHEVWCGVARLAETKESAEKPRPSPTAPTATGGAHSKSWHEMSPAQQAGLLCGEESFRAFLARHMKFTQPAADAVRDYCNVKSRKDILPDTAAGERWRRLVSDYRSWMREPQVIG